MRHRWLAVPLAAASASLLAACAGTSAPAGNGGGGGGGNGPAAPPASAPATASASPTGPGATPQSGSPAAGATIKVRSTSKGMVLTDAQGKTLYWFAVDSPTMSKCNGSCASVWPPVTGTATAAAGTSLPHSFGTITRSDGSKQVTYDGHPLYTYAADTAPGQVKGNGINQSGGLWWAETPSDAKLSGSGGGARSGGGSGGGGSGGGGSGGGGSGSSGSGGRSGGGGPTY